MSALHEAAMGVGLYAFLATMYGFASKQIAVEVIREFQKVKGIKWPADMLEALGVYGD